MVSEFSNISPEHGRDFSKLGVSVLPSKELDPTITCAFFVGGNDKSCLDVVFDPDFTDRLFAYSVQKHLPHLLGESC